jgi:hypothetical protein
MPAQTTPAAPRHAKKTRAEWAELARGFQRKTVEGLIGLGKTLIKAKADLEYGEFGAMLRDDLKIEVRFAQRVMKLARNRYFAKASNLTHLPTALSALCELSDVPEDDLEAGKQSGAINPHMTAKQAKRVRIPVEYTKESFKVPAYIDPPVELPFARMYVPPSATERLIADLKEIEQRLRDLLVNGRLETANRQPWTDLLEQFRRVPELAEPRETEPDENAVPLLPGPAQASPT